MTVIKVTLIDDNDGTKHVAKENYHINQAMTKLVYNFLLEFNTHLM